MNEDDLTPRDIIAMHAMTALLTPVLNQTDSIRAFIATNAYLMADAMLAAREPAEP